MKAKYVYGVTATPMRGDGLEKITYRMIGPVRYSYGARDMAKEQGIRHLLPDDELLEGRNFLHLRIC